MIRAILEGRKTQTRRVVKHGALSDVIHVDGELWRANIYGMQKLHCPFGVPGDRLWVRETWARPEDTEETQACVYRADYDPPRVGDYGLWRRRDRAKEWFEGVWSPSIHMPRWASRITLRVTSVRVERVQAISEEDARAEGVEPAGGFMATSGCWQNYAADGPSLSSARGSFTTLWDSVNGKRPGAAWRDNPFVWAVGFEVERRA